MQLEHLEARYALDAAPVANDDSLVALYQQPSTPFIEVLNNDTDADTLAFLLHVSKVNGANVSTSVGTPQTFSLPQGSLVLRADHQIFDFTPAANFTGSFSFRYNIDDGPDPGNPLDPIDTSNEATVSVQVKSTTAIGQNVDLVINEGEGLDLDDLDTNDTSQTRAPGPLTYFWYVDANEAHVSSIPSNYLPSDDDLVGPASGSSSSVLHVNWSELNDVDITSGLDHQAIVTLKVRDLNGQIATRSAFMDVTDVSPEITSFTVEAAGCGAYTLNATFHDVNPVDNFTVSVDWNWSLAPVEPVPVPDQTLSYTNNHDGTFTVTATTHSYAAGTYIPVLLIDAVGEHSQAFIDGAFLNVPPSSGGPPTVAINGAPWSANEGTLLNLTSTATSTCTPISSYAWSVTNYGLPVTLPPGTPTNLPTFNFTPPDDGSYDITLSVNGGAASDTKTVYVGNLPPSVSLAAVQNLGSGPQVSVSGTITDPGTGDTIEAASIDWGDGSPTNPITVTGAAGSFACTAPSHTYKTTGIKTITVTATDDDDGSATAQTVLTVRVALDSAGTLRVLGTSDGDAVAINAPNSLVRVDTSFLTAPADFPTSGVQRIIVDLGAGSDALVVAGNVNKYLVALGGAGDDVMTDGPARSILIGGDGTDILLGGRGEDVLIAGATTFDSNDAALLLILAEWTSATDINLRMSHLKGATGGLNGANYLNATTILGDSSIDILSGGNGTDWLIISPQDIALDAKKDFVEQLI